MKLSNLKSFSKLEWFFFIGIVWLQLGLVFDPFGVYFEATALEPIWGAIVWLVSFPGRVVDSSLLRLVDPGPDIGLGATPLAIGLYFLTIISINFFAVLLIWVIKKKLFWQGIMITIFSYAWFLGVMHFIEIERYSASIKMSETMEVELKRCGVEVEDRPIFKEEGGSRMLKCELAISIPTRISNNDTGLSISFDFSKQNGESIGFDTIRFSRATELIPTISIKLNIPADTNVNDIYISQG